MALSHIKDLERAPEKHDHQTTICDHDFADDIDLVESAFEGEKEQISLLARLAREIALEVNAKKTKAFTAIKRAAVDKIKLEGEPIEWVDDFKQLGSTVASSATDIKIRKGQARAAFIK